jgi:nucleoside diphosphate kinase
MHPKKERTLVILKPDAVQRGLVGEIVKRIEQIGLKIVAMKMEVLEEDKIWAHYNKDDAWYQRKGAGILENKKKLGHTIDKEAIEYGKDIIRAMIKFMRCSPSVIMVIEGNQSMAVVKRLVGRLSHDCNSRFPRSFDKGFFWQVARGSKLNFAFSCVRCASPWLWRF